MSSPGAGGGGGSLDVAIDLFTASGAFEPCPIVIFRLGGGSMFSSADLCLSACSFGTWGAHQG